MASLNFRSAALLPAAIVLALVGTGVLSALTQPLPQRNPAAEKANADVARRLGQLVIDNAHIIAAADAVVEQLAAAEKRIKELEASCAAKQ